MARGTLAKAKTAARTVMFRERVAVRRYGTAERRILLRDPTSRAWYDRDWPPLPPEIREAFSRSGTVFDIGAHQCVVAMMLAEAVGDEGRVVAVEPSRHNVAVAEANIRLNGVGNLEVVRAAVGAADGWTRFPDARSLDVRARRFRDRRREIPLTTVDTLATRFGIPTCIFVDVDGAEGEVLRGASRTLMASECDSWIVEVHVGCGLERFDATPADLVDVFHRHEFDVLLGDADYGTPFRPYAPSDPLLGGRFVLIATRSRD